ncbi:Flp pilus assembly protein TadB [Rhodococcus sp. LBL1]|uniref:Flp pilus assembly protein TadB n=1 Tax=Prescottella agglutinans TaxID=1644129 RepID=A0ABT6M5W2_9NOCA|nr:hypothetical protein [Prescottella agglutinans]MDH6279690.1 Flp pilus assembly protein TadB [Prescottella agglutinans]MDH6678119.1 Flp pilus assembly protein TadB [Rhodococcus sp. LBL1]MDH6683706.1 Flp pilus assembly protein TadB [Rhodococcus sp. LBL2]
MTAVLHGHAPHRAHVTVDIAGTAWPIYKLEAIAAGVLVFLLILTVTQALQTAVLTAAGTAVVVWWTRRVMLTRRRR